MKLLFSLLMIVILASCSNQQPPKEQEPTTGHHHHEQSTPALQLNNGNKWKADIPTRQNVDAMMAILNDPQYANGEKPDQLKSALKSSIETLVKECKMAGPDHDMLHVWLENLLSDLKETGEGSRAPSESFAALKHDIESFYQYFE